MTARLRPTKEDLVQSLHRHLALDRPKVAVLRRYRYDVLVEWLAYADAQIARKSPPPNVSALVD